MDELPTTNRLSTAGFTFTPPTIQALIGVEMIIWMALRAMCFSRMMGSYANTAKDVLSHRHWLQVLRPNAWAIAAEVVEGEAVRNGANEQFVGEAMGENVLPVDPKNTIAPTDSGTGSPPPAGICESHLTPKTLFQIHLPINRWVAVFPPAQIMLVTPTTQLYKDRVIAIWDATLGLHRNQPFVAMRPDASTSRSLLLYHGIR